jgi:hypothetical protein
VRVWRWITGLALVLAACSNLFAPARPSGFDGWFHLDRSDVATNIRFADPGVLQVRVLDCTNEVSADQEWSSESDTVIATQWPGTPHFTHDSQGGLLASPGLYSGTEEHWTPGALCAQCPPVDAGITVACDSPAVRDGGV